MRDLAAGPARVPPVNTAIAETLLAAPAAGHLAEAAAGDDAWIVGGAVRDALAGRPVVDLDLAVDGDEAAVAKRLAAVAGG